MHLKKNTGHIAQCCSSLIDKAHCLLTLSLRGPFQSWRGDEELGTNGRKRKGRFALNVSAVSDRLTLLKRRNKYFLP
jgi:hypothetical protein